MKHSQKKKRLEARVQDYERMLKGLNAIEKEKMELAFTRPGSLSK